MAWAKRIYILIIKVNKLFSLVKVWEHSKKLWKNSPAARVPTAFLVLPNFHSCFYTSIETWRACFLFLNDYTVRPMSEQHEPNPALWLALSVQDGAILPAQDYWCVPRVCSVIFSCNKFFIDQACSVKIAGYWPPFFAHLRTWTLYRSINTQKKNLANALGQYLYICAWINNASKRGN